jgi:hypothetical protein
MKAVNLGCGARFHPDWENVDDVPAGAGIRAWDLRQGVPYSSDSFDVVYHSHVLEHFSKADASVFLRECLRVLKPSGVLRVVVPDLENIARSYLESLDNAARGVPGWDQNREWMVLEMYDQTVREQSGGMCADYIRRDPVSNWNFIAKRMGTHADVLRCAMKSRDDDGHEHNSNGKGRNWSYILRHPATVARNKILRTVLGKKDWNSLQVGRFRASGEIHLWMYDSYSLGRLLIDAGFANPIRCTAFESQIPHWESFHLDSEPDGRVYKGDSLYMEAIKP